MKWKSWILMEMERPFQSRINGLRLWRFMLSNLPIFHFWSETTIQEWTKTDDNDLYHISAK
jgi:hypothetical protein